MDYRESAERICARLEQLGLHAAVVFYPEKLSVEQLYGTVRYLEGLQEFLFYVPGGTVISSEAVSYTHLTLPTIA